MKHRIFDIIGFIKEHKLVFFSISSVVVKTGSSVFKICPFGTCAILGSHHSLFLILSSLIINWTREVMIRNGMEPVTLLVWCITWQHHKCKITGCESLNGQEIAFNFCFLGNLQHMSNFLQKSKRTSQYFILYLLEIIH